MKLCWDNIENIRLTKTGYFKDILKGTTYVYKESCKNCGHPFLSIKYSSKPKEYCCSKCANSGENNPMYGRIGNNSPNKGKKRTKEQRKKISEGQKGRKLSDETKKKIGEKSKGRSKGDKNYFYNKHFYGNINGNWKGGITEKNLSSYDTYTPQLQWCEEVRRSPKDKNILEIRCTYCRKWFIPNRNEVDNRCQYLKGNYNSENRFYCSEKCKHTCPLYRKTPEQLIRNDSIRSGNLKWLELSREVQGELRQLVLERDGHQCVKCGIKENLHCHHILPVAVEPLLSADIDNCETLCKNCHKAAHKKDGCGYNDYKYSC